MASSARSVLSLWMLTSLVAIVAVGCTNPGGPAPASGPGAGSGQGRQSVHRTLVVSEGREIDALVAFGQTDNEATDLVYAGMVYRNAATFQEEPWLLEELPSVESGTWKLNPDGTMVVTYKLRPNIKWHDGTAFSPKDFVFGREANLEPRLAFRNRRHAQLVDRFETPDERTLVAYWNRHYPFANRPFRTEMIALPRHVLEPMFRAGEFERFENNPFWNRELVGTGPYRVIDFQPAAVLELEAFPDYFLGKPKIDRITLRVIPDSNVMLTNVLTNDVHLTLRSGLTIEGAIAAKAQWETAGEGKVIITPINWRWLNLSGMNPWFDDARVRQALLHAIDREEMVRTLSQGLEQVIHVPLSPFRPQFQRVDAAITKYPYDPSRAERLLEEAGWRRGADGVRVNSRGERFSFDGRTRAGDNENERIQAATVSYWRAVGAEVTINNIASRAERDPEYRNHWPGAYWGSHNIQVEDWYDRYHSVNIPTADNRWVPENVSRWASPQKDALLDEMNATMDRKRWDDLVVDFSQLFAKELPHLPMKYASEVTTVRKGLVGVHPRIESGGENSRTWNAHLWEWAS